MTQFRPVRVAVAVAVLFGVLSALRAFILPPAIHHLRIWLNGGDWCAITRDDGLVVPYYGEECDQLEEDLQLGPPEI